MTPYPLSSFSYKFNFFRFLFKRRYFFTVGPIEDLIKFLPKSKLTKFIALFIKYSAPWVLIRFYDILSYFMDLFLLSGIDRIYAPLIPISLSSNLRVSNFLFWSNIAARHLAPSIPKEFFLILPSKIPDYINEIYTKI